AGRPILEVLERGLDERDREIEVLAPPAAFEQLDQAVREERVIVEIRREAGAAVLVCREQAIALPHAPADEIRGAGRVDGEVRPAETPSRPRERTNREPVPAREDLLVAGRPHAPLASLEQLGPRALEQSH